MAIRELRMTQLVDEVVRYIVYVALSTCAAAESNRIKLFVWIGIFYGDLF